jgi:Domain of unknown function (DUF4386)
MTEKLNTYRTTATIVGLVFIAGMVIGVGGNILNLSILDAPDPLANVSANSMLLAVAAFAWLLTVVGDAAHGVMVLFILLQIPLASEYLKAGGSDTANLQALSTMFVQVNLYAYHIAMFTLGIAGSLLCYVFYKAKLVPRLVAVWGLIGYAIIFFGSALEVFGFNLQTIHAIPGGLWELFIGVWLIAKGFNPSAFASESATSENGGWTGDRPPAAVSQQGAGNHRR